MAAASTSMAATAALLPPRATRTSVAAARVSSLPYLPSRFSSHPAKLYSEPQRLSLVQIRASSDDSPASVDAGELFTDLKEKWDALENKSTVILYGGGAIVAVWLSSVVVGAINSVPLLPKIMELVGLGYTGWFVYRYLLFKALIFFNI
ncbi:protein CURVATURE THYLAKOID 1A, chloroplastic isoform X2 [Rhodamnia argentea]|uniref:Protein CURVATURE THYLAKOID 1A, chloroplastic isoform X2 n=1 Tax=Rhodamnia argentea TaxID=178133 RepID=A0ABM3HY86_9MYRT|nr:protein CURVATURE THYLAKOID 1A, chloroplastic isoform X2 [Rhodamnia argentea]